MSKCDIHDGQDKNKYRHSWKKEKGVPFCNDRKKERERGRERERGSETEHERRESNFAKCNLVERIKGNLDAKMVICNAPIRTNLNSFTCYDMPSSIG